MIFSPLSDLYDQLLAQGRAPRPGFTFERIGGEIVLDVSGGIVEVNSFLRQDGKFVMRRKMDVPASCGRTSGIEANLLWDKTSYMLGVTAKTDNKDKPVLDTQGNKIPCQAKNTLKQHARFGERHHDLFGNLGDTGLGAISLFLNSWSPNAYLSVFPAALLDENLVFRLEGDVHSDGTPRFIHERPAALEIVQAQAKTLDQDRVCAITGIAGPCVSNHPAIKGVQGAQSSGAYLSSFNFDSSKSFGLDGAENAPVSVGVAAKAAAALNVLLERDSDHKVMFGDTTIVFWVRDDENTAQDAALDLEEAFLLGTGEWMEDEASQVRASSFFEAVRQGRIDPETYRNMRFCMLGLAPSDARLRVRFYREEAPLDLIEKITQHQDALALDGERFTPRPWDILGAIARKDKNGKPIRKDLDPHLERELGRSIIEGAPYPQGMLPTLIERIRAEKGDDKVTATRVAILKAILSRMPQQKDIPMGLDPNLDDPGYQLGRLFALIESTQRRARPDIRATIRDRYMSAASTTPASIFPELLRSAQPNMTKMRRNGEAGLATWFDRQIAEICAQLGGNFPRTLGLPAQGRFFAGYYQQAHTRTKPDNDTSIIEQEQSK